MGAHGTRGLELRCGPWPLASLRWRRRRRRAHGALVKPSGAAAPVRATGIGTAAAMDDPRCSTGSEFGIYGNWNTTTVGGGGTGPVCVAAWSDDADNGGATSPGVTAEKIVVVAIVPSHAQTEQLLADATQSARCPGEPRDRGRGELGGRGPRPPAAVPGVLRDVGPRRRGAVRSAPREPTRPRNAATRSRSRR